MSEKFRVVVNYKDESNRVVAESVALNTALFLQDGFWSIDEDQIRSISVERVEEGEPTGWQADSPSKTLRGG